VGGDAVAVGIHTEMLADLARAGCLLGRGPGEVHGFGAGLVELAGPWAKRVHVK
jgi:hypothetical protein